MIHLFLDKWNRKSYNLTVITKKFQQKLKRKGVNLVFLFGSQVKGFTHKESDVDIAVLLGERVKVTNYFKKCIELSSVFKELFPCKEREIVILNQAPPLLKHEVLAGGRLLFLVDEDEFTRFNLQAVHQYEDTKPIRQLQYFYLKERIKDRDF